MRTRARDIAHEAWPRPALPLAGLADREGGAGPGYCPLGQGAWVWRSVGGVGRDRAVQGRSLSWLPGSTIPRAPILLLTWTTPRGQGGESGDGSTLYVLNKQEAKKAFTRTTDSDRINILRDLIAEEQDGDQILLADLKQALALLEFRREQKSARSHECESDQMSAAKVWLVTYNDPTFVVEALSAEGSARMDEKALVEAVQKEPRALAIFKDFEAFAASLHEKHPGLEAVQTAEVCLDTYRARGEVRLHLHLALGRIPRLAFTLHELVFASATPYSNPQQGLKCATNMVKRSGYQGVRNQAFYYVSVDKIGSVFESGDLKPHRDYIVNPSWVSGLLEASALTVICRDVFSLC